MESKCNNGKFWIGLGMGAVLGVVAYWCAKSDRAKQLKEKMHCMAQQAAEKAGEWATGVKQCATQSEE